MDVEIYDAKPSWAEGIALSQEALSLVRTWDMERLLDEDVMPILRESMQMYRNPLAYSSYLGTQSAQIYCPQEGGWGFPPFKVRLEAPFPAISPKVQFGECMTIGAHAGPLLIHEFQTACPGQYQVSGAVGLPNQYFLGGSEHYFLVVERKQKAKSPEYLVIDPALGAIALGEKVRGSGNRYGIRTLAALNITRHRKPTYPDTRKGEQVILGILSQDPQQSCVILDIEPPSGESGQEVAANLKAKLQLVSPDGQPSSSLDIIAGQALPDIRGLTEHDGTRNDLFTIAENIRKMLENPVSEIGYTYSLRS